MIEQVSFNAFCDAFKGDVGSNRENQFSYDGKKALYDYLEEYEESTNTKVELDIIALCCEYTEFDSVEDYLESYNTDIEREEYDTEEEYNKAVLNEIQEKTTLINIEKSNHFIIQNF